MIDGIHQLFFLLGNIEPYIFSLIVLIWVSSAFGTVSLSIPLTIVSVLLIYISHPDAETVFSSWKSLIGYGVWAACFVCIFTVLLQKACKYVFEIKREQVIIFRYRLPVDARYKVVYTIALILLLATFYISEYISTNFADNVDVKNFYISFYASWVEDISFFLSAGVVALVLSLKRPIDAPFRKRVRSLFSEEEGDVIDYNTKEAMQLAVYSTKTKRTVIFHKEDANLGAYYCTVITEMFLRNLLHDEPFSYPIGIKIFTDGLKLASSHEPQVLTVAKFGEESLIGDRSHVIVDNIKGLDLEFPNICLEPDETKIFHTEYKIWFKKGEDFSYATKRFTEKYSLVLERSSPTVAPLVEFTSNKQQIRVDSDRKLTYISEGFVKPNEETLCFKVL